ncbi:hypothetical protein LCGC14_1290080 [marine sediment metagenome]|uniref:Uncharacterized protein n=1 Tax=marine sediment metagenome TaxID=412755 RepID=A0A0F9LDN7_9ZZZZ
MSELYGKVELVERTTITTQGEVVKLWRLSATTKGGVRFTIDVPEAELEPGKVAALLEKKAATIEGIRKL